VKKGQELGVAYVSDMLHFEIYSGRQNENTRQRWYPPKGQKAANPDKCARVFLHTKPKALDDPRPWILKTLAGKWC
jgi:hypothetical protein